MEKKYLFVIAAMVVCAVAIFGAGCTTTGTGNQEDYVATVDVIQIGAGMQINSLSLGQIDGMINWQPNVSAATVSGIGKVVSYSQNLPRSDNGTWAEHTCCVFGANKTGVENKDLATVLTYLMLVANKYITDDPANAAKYVADWMYGDTPLEYGGMTLTGVQILTDSLPTIKFNTEASENWLSSNYEFLEIQRSLGAISGNLKSTSKEDTEKIIYNFTAYNTAKSIVNGTATLPTPVSDGISIGYLLSDHDAPLFVLVKNWEYFRDNCNAYLKPESTASGLVEKAELYVNGKKICNVSFEKAEGGPALMTLLQSDKLQYAVAGTPPYLSSIDIQTGLKILSPIMTEGSALVVSANAPANNWEEFVNWAIKRSAEGKNVTIAIPQKNSIQDVQLKSALESAKIKYQTLEV